MTVLLTLAKDSSTTPKVASEERGSGELLLEVIFTVVSPLPFSCVAVSCVKFRTPQT